MSQMSNTVYKSFVAGADLSSARYLFVELGSNANEVTVVNATTDIPIGVVTDFYRGTQGMPVTVAIGGTTKVVAGGSISKGAWVGPGTGGKAAAKTNNGDIVRGIALESATADGEIIEILLVGPFVLNVPQ